MMVPARSTRPGLPLADRLDAAFARSTIPGSMLDDLREQGHLADIDLHFAALIAELDGSDGPELPVAAALASAWTRDGHACIALPEVAGRQWPRAGAVQLPALERWIEALGESPVVAGPEDPKESPLVLDDRGRLYLQRLWVAEQTVAAGILRLADEAEIEPAGFDSALDRLVPGTERDDPARTAARTAVRRRICVVSGGPGTGKTTIAASIVALFVELELAAPDRIALVAPTGKAAARLQEAVRGRHRELAAVAPALEGYEVEATTVHRWLLHRGRARREGLPVDALILDEGSMVDLTLMARMLELLPDRTRLVVLGDASQLASVQPGSVFADICRAGTGAGAPGSGTCARTKTEARARTAPVPASSPLAPCVVELVRNWRFDEAGGIGRLAAAVVHGDASGAIAALADSTDDATQLRPLPAGRPFRTASGREFADQRFAPVLRTMQTLREPEAGAGPLAPFRVLCAHRGGPFGAERFNRSVERRLRDLDLVRGEEALLSGPPDPRHPQRPADRTLQRRTRGSCCVTQQEEFGCGFPELEDSDGAAADWVVPGSPSCAREFLRRDRAPGTGLGVRRGRGGARPGRFPHRDPGAPVTPRLPGRAGGWSCTARWRASRPPSGA